ncbi:hypothetical protein PLICRDRAFT_90346 [Plicaturopsis crispa FD-325 SS-3]|nr:hypothetical protein PLICRDRAFT_90346 [Plicaturopsis crispa FD-325 SS-3]
MHASLIRRQLGGIVPPKIATPSHLSGGSASSLTPLVDFYSKLPKGRATAYASRGLKGRFFNGKNASPAPLFATIGGLFLIGYTIDYQMHLKHHKNHAH